MTKNSKIIDLLKINEVPHIDEITNFYRSDVLLNAIPSKNTKEFNEKGYRSDSFFDNGDLKVISIGCSDVFGYNLDKKDRFSDVFCEKVSNHLGCKVVNWNLGLPGKSNDYIARTLASTKSILKPDIVLVSFTRIVRREWFPASCLPLDYIYKHKNEVSNHFDVLANYNQNILNFYINYKLIESLFCDVNFMFTLSLNTGGKFVGLDDILKIVDLNKYVGYFDTIDNADPAHPGVLSNLKLATNFFEKYKGIKQK